MAIRGISDALEVQGPEKVSYRLPDGSSLVLNPDTSVRFHPPGPGGRVSLELMRGSLEADVAKGEGLFKVLSGAGEVRVVGTRFKAAAGGLVRFPLPSPERLPEPPLPFLCVDVGEGRVLLQNGSGNVFVSASGRGLLLADRPPFQLDQGGTPRKVLEQFAPMLELAEGGPRIRPDLQRDAEFLAALFHGLEGKDDLKAGTREELAALEILERMGAR